MRTQPGRNSNKGCKLKPRTAPGTSENRFDHLHIGKGIFNWCRYVRVVEYCARKGIALDGILVADLELDLLGLISMSIPDGARLVGRGVERDLDLNLTLCAKDVDPLVWRQLRGAGERRSAASEVQYTRGEAIGLELGIVLDYAGDAPGFSAKEKTRRRNRIASDVQHSSASKVAPIANVVRISEVV